MVPLAGSGEAFALSRTLANTLCANLELLAGTINCFRIGNAEMITKGRLSGVLMLLPLLQAASVAVAEDAPFTYSDDWGLVSAPPPPGPYRAVNIDPRVPGQDAIPPITTGAESSRGWEHLPAEIYSNPPAAGRPSLPQAETPQIQHSSPGNAGPAPVPGAYGSRMQRPPDYRFPEPNGMPNPEQYTTYGNMPPSGYYRSPAVQMEQEVPPPPVYDSMTGESGDAYGRPRGQ
jgi:hypothetical protein